MTMLDAAKTPMSNLIASVASRLLSGEWRLILEHPNPAEGTSICSPDVSQEVGRRLSTITPAEVGGLVDAQTEARAIAWRGEYKQPGTDRWIVRYVDDGKPTGKNWRNVLPLFDATALAAKDAELAAEHAALRLAADRADRTEAQLAEAHKALIAARTIIQEDRDAMFDSVTVAGDASTMDEIDRPAGDGMTLYSAAARSPAAH